jgi:hypothetical protein
MGSERDRIGPDGLTDQQRAAGHAPRKHSVAAGQRQPALAEPLSEVELRTGGGYGPAITDVDCTPRPRYRETPAAFAARMLSYGVDVQALKADVRQRNRAAALREGVWPDGAVFYFTQCACKWHGLRVADPEVARREYDAHACAAESLGDDAVSRAQAHAGRATMPAKRTTSVLKPAIVEPVVDELRPTKQDLEDLDEASQRFALLELGKP